MPKRVITRAIDDPEDLVDLVAARLALTTERARQLVECGSVYVDGERADSARPVAAGEKILVYTDANVVESDLVFVHRDDWIAVVDKPAGMATQPERSQRTGALEARVQQHIGGVARAMHRLDKEASGLVLFGVRARAFAPLQQALTTGAIDRRYLAIVDGELRGEGTIRLRIARHPADARRRTALPEGAPAGEPACSHWRALAHATWQRRPLTAVELRLETGRTHQLRVHLSAIGHRIVGDAAYDGLAFERLCLHAYALELPHPRDGQRLHLHAPIPGPLARLVPGLTSPFA